MRPKVSVVMPAHNRAGTIVGSICSVESQDYFIANEYEIVVVDDCSSDNTEELVKELQSRNKSIRYIKNTKNMGANYSRNLGVQNASFDYIFFHDSDDYWLPEKVSRHMREHFRTESEFVFSSHIKLNKNKVSIYPDFLPKESCRIAESEFHLFLSKNPVSTQCLSVTRAAFEKIGGFDNALPRFQDWDFSIRALGCCSVYYIATALVVVCDTPGSISKNFRAGISARESLLGKHKEVFEKYNMKKKFIRDSLIRKVAAKILGR